MKTKNFSIILICVSIILFVVAITMLSKNNNFSNIIGNNNKKEEKITNISKEETNNDTKQEIEENINTEVKEEINNDVGKEENTKEEIKEVVNNNQNTEEKEEITPNPTPSVKPVPITTPTPAPSLPKEETINTEEGLISYLEKQENELTNADENDSTLREKAKNIFVSIIDFIFYDKEIKGYKFKDLTTTAKLKVIKIALAIDNKIDSYFPNYKDKIKDKYTSIKGKLAVKYLEFSSYLCEKVGEDTCNQAKEDFNSMKSSFGFTWDLIKELASSGSSKIKELYEAWRD